MLLIRIAHVRATMDVNECGSTPTADFGALARLDYMSFSEWQYDANSGEYYRFHPAENIYITQSGRVIRLTGYAPAVPAEAGQLNA